MLHIVHFPLTFVIAKFSDSCVFTEMNKWNYWQKYFQSSREFLGVHICEYFHSNLYSKHLNSYIISKGIATINTKVLKMDLNYNLNDTLYIRIIYTSMFLIVNHGDHPKLKYIETFESWIVFVSYFHVYVMYTAPYRNSTLNLEKSRSS